MISVFSGGKIDIAHHETKARKALDETAELAKAVEAALRMVDPENTLVVVTSDHSHTMTYSGYSKRGSDILGLVNAKVCKFLSHYSKRGSDISGLINAKVCKSLSHDSKRVLVILGLVNAKVRKSLSHDGKRVLVILRLDNVKVRKSLSH